MQLRTKQRLIGALVLIALLAIFLPLLFHHSRPSAELTLSTKMPPKPQQPQVQLQLPVMAAKAESQKAIAQQQTKQQVAKPLKLIKAVSATQTNKKNNKQSRSKQKTLASMKNKKAEIQSKQKTLVSMKSKKDQIQPKHKTLVSKNKKDRKPKHKPSKQALSKALAVPEAWVVKLASFTDQKNALRLIKKLRQNAFDAYSRKTLNAKGQAVYRVFVGPSIKQSNIEKIQKELKQRFHLTGVIKKYEV